MKDEQILLAQAMAFAALKHAGQMRKDDTPYIYHPLKVAELVKDYGYGIKYQIVAILHDTLEDTDATEDDIRVFGEDVLEAIKLLTRPVGMNEEEYLDLILKNHLATVVKNADKIHNMWEVAYAADKKWARWYVKKSKRYYEGKFSYALDRSLEFARERLSIHNPEKKVQNFTHRSIPTVLHG